MDQAHQFIHNRKGSKKSKKIFWKSTFRVLGLGSWVPCLISWDLGSWVLGPTYKIGPGSWVLPKVHGLGARFSDVSVKNRYGQSALWTLKLTVSQEWTNEINSFLHAGTSLCKLKGDWKFLGFAWSKKDVASYIMVL